MIDNIISTTLILILISVSSFVILPLIGAAFGIAAVTLLPLLTTGLTTLILALLVFIIVALKEAL